MIARAMVARAMLAITCLVLAAIAQGQAPAGSTGECKDGTYTTAPSKRGACSRHGGVKEWYAESSTPAPASAAPKAVPAPAPAAVPAPAPSRSATKPTEMPKTAAAGGGPGQVWVNTASKVYHCPNDRWYGKTKNGEYMSEAAAKAAGSLFQRHRRLNG